MSKVVFSKAARADRRAITAYTVKRFDIQQARRLRERFEATMDSIAAAPLTGHRREDLDPPGRSFRYLSVLKTFIIVYEPTGDGIRVVRILHGARDLGFCRDSDQMSKPVLDISALTPEERLRLIDELWESLVIDPRLFR